MSEHPFRTLQTQSLLLVAWAVISSASVLAQPSLQVWGDQLLSRRQLSDFQEFSSVNPNWELNQKSPKLKSSVPALDDLELALQAWSNDKELENRCIQKLLEDQSTLFSILNVLDALYRSDIDAHWSVDLAPSYRWLPALTNGMNHTFAQESKGGLWNLEPQEASSSGLKMDGQIDERFIPGMSTEAAVQELKKLQRRFPNDPHRVLVAYVRGMAYATRWTGKPGFDRNLDEWLTLYKVVARFMVNLERVDYQLDWMALAQSWAEPKCSVDHLTRSTLLDEGNMTESDLSLFIPWWKGQQLFCQDLMSYGCALPPAQSNAWKRAIGELSSTPSGKESSKGVGVSSSKPSSNPQSKPAEVELVWKEIKNDKEAVPCILHEVKQGDTLWNISKRYPGTTPELIAEINDITDYIRIGQALCIPKRE